MEQKELTLSPEAIVAIEALQHKNGTYRYYTNALKRLASFLLHQSDEIGMSDAELIATLRAFDSLCEDLALIAGPVANPPAEDDDAETVGKVLNAFDSFNFEETETSS